MATPVVNPPPAGDQLPPAPPKPTVDPEVTRLRQELDQQKQTTKNIMDRLAAQLPATPGPNTPPDKKALEKEFFSKPLESTAQIARDVAEAIAQRGREEMGGQFETLKAVARDKVRATDPELFDKYVLEIESKVHSMGPNYQTNIHVWQSAFNVTKGEHLSEIRAMAAPPDPNRAPSVHISNEGGPAAPSKQANQPKADKLTEEEHNVAQRLGITDDQYRAGKEHIAGQSERGPSSWDPYITFDSRAKRKQERDAKNRRAAA